MNNKFATKKRKLINKTIVWESECHKRNSSLRVVDQNLFDYKDKNHSHKNKQNKKSKHKSIARKLISKQSVWMKTKWMIERKNTKSKQVKNKQKQRPFIGFSRGLLSRSLMN